MSTCRGYFIMYLALLFDVAVFCTRVPHLDLATIPTSFALYSCYRRSPFPNFPKWLFSYLLCTYDSG